MDKIAVLIPCYNEEKTIQKVIADWKSSLPEAKIYVYDNNSTDNTVNFAEQRGAIIGYEPKQGKGNVIRRMFREIDAHCYILVDGDDTYPAESGSEMVNAVLARNIDMVIGDRLTSTYFKENKRAFHNFGNTLVRKIINSLFQTDIKDIMIGCRAMSYQFVKSFPVLSQGFEIETEMTIHAVERNMSIENIVIAYRDRPEGSESKLNTFTDGTKVICTIGRLYKNYRPFACFGGLSAVLALIAFIFFVPVFITYLETGLVPNFPSLIVSGFTSLAAIISFFSGLILSTIVEKDRQAFEFRLLQIKKEEIKK